MDLSRFEELKIQGKKTTCPKCKEEFIITHDKTTGGGYGMIGLKCPRCTNKFGIEMESD